MKSILLIKIDSVKHMQDEIYIRANKCGVYTALTIVKNISKLKGWLGWIYLSIKVNKLVNRYAGGIKITK